MLERMEDFFARRVEEYDEHMLQEVEGCEEGYRQMATLVPGNTLNLLDLGCGTGLELQAIWEKKPDIMVYAIDLCPQMLEKLKEKYADKNMTVVCGDYFRHPFGRNHFDVAVSFESFHHYTAKFGLLYGKMGCFCWEITWCVPRPKKKNCGKKTTACARRKDGVGKSFCTATFRLP